MITFDVRKNIVCTTGALIAALAFTAAAAGPAQAATAHPTTASIAASVDHVEIAAASPCNESQRLSDRLTNRRLGGRVIDGTLSEARA